MYYTNNEIETMLYDFLTENNIATESEIELVTNIIGYNEETLFKILFAKTECRNIEQAATEGYYISEALRDYYEIEEVA